MLELVSRSRLDTLQSNLACHEGHVRTRKCHPCNIRATMGPIVPNWWSSAKGLAWVNEWRIRTRARYTWPHFRLWMQMQVIYMLLYEKISLCRCLLSNMYINYIRLTGPASAHLQTTSIAAEQFGVTEQHGMSQMPYWPAQWLRWNPSWKNTNMRPPSAVILSGPLAGTACLRVSSTSRRAAVTENCGAQLLINVTSLRV